MGHAMRETFRQYMSRRQKEEGVREPMFGPAVLYGFSQCPGCGKWTQGGRQLVRMRPQGYVEFVCSEPCAQRRDAQDVVTLPRTLEEIAAREPLDFPSASIL